MHLVWMKSALILFAKMVLKDLAPDVMMLTNAKIFLVIMMPIATILLVDTSVDVNLVTVVMVLGVRRPPVALVNMERVVMTVIYCLLIPMTMVMATLGVIQDWYQNLNTLV